MVGPGGVVEIYQVYKISGKEIDMKYSKIEGANNIRAAIKDNSLYLKIDLSQEGKESSSGLSTILAQTNRFASLEEICEKPIGLNLIVTEKKVKKAKKVKKKGKREDDED